MRAVRRTLIGAGALILAYAAGGAWGDRDVKAGVLVFLIAVLLVHDGVLLPAIIAAGGAVRRLCPPALRAYLIVVLLLGTGVAFVGLPMLVR